MTQAISCFRVLHLHVIATNGGKRVLNDYLFDDGLVWLDMVFLTRVEFVGQFFSPAINRCILKKYCHVNWNCMASMLDSMLGEQGGAIGT